MFPQGAISLAVAGLLGLAVGIEREWSGRTAGPDARFAGARTFLLLGLLGGTAGWLAQLAMVPLAAALLAGGAALAVVAYAIAARRGAASADGTTEAAAILVLGLGVLAGIGELRLATGAAVVVVIALKEKQRVHALVAQLGEQELRSAIGFAAMSIIILPLLPDESYGPLGGVQPRALWIIVLIFTGLNFLGYLARRALGAARGYGVAGMIGGLVSSTAVALEFSRRSHKEPELSAPLALGVVGACTVLLVRLITVTSVLNREVAVELFPYLVPPLIVGGVFVAFGLTRAHHEKITAADVPAGNESPLRLGSAIKMTVAFQLVLWAVAWVRAHYGQTEILASAALLGLTDMDALTVSMTKLGADAAMVPLAALAIAVGVVSNTVLKMGLVLVLGSPGMRRFGGIGLAILGVASVVGIWAMRR